MQNEDELMRPEETISPRDYRFIDSRLWRLVPKGQKALEDISRGFFRLASAIGCGVLIPNLAFAIREGDIFLFVLNCACFAMVAALALWPRKANRLLRASLIVAFFVLGTYQELRFGVVSAGGAWFCSATLFATMFYGLLGLVLSCGSQVLTCLVLGFAMASGRLGWECDTLAFVAFSIGTIGLGSVAGLATETLYERLRLSFDLRRELASELDARKGELERETAVRHDAELRADFLETHDQLTRLPNRESFERSLREAVRAAAGRGRILGVMAIGIDRFMRINETHGPGASDAILIETAGRLLAAFRSDDLVARSGEADFLVLLSDVKSPEDAKDIIEKIKRPFDRSFNVGGQEVGLSASFGLALFPNDGDRAEELILAAEAALRLSNEDGPGSYRLFDASLHARLVKKLLIEHELRAAIRSGSFIPWYQPKVDCLGRIIGAEALARWSLPDGSLRQPADFIAAAERSGFIGDLGRIVLFKSCERAASWPRSGLEPIPVSVNLSPYQFRSEDIVKDIRSILGTTGLEPSRLDLEITESGIMEEGTGAIEKLAELKALGCSISIDDFGTGYSSFATLRDYPVDCVKLPQSFVEPLPADGRASTIASAVIALAHSLDFRVVAEGVENREQFAWLDHAACDQYQGFLFSKPLPAEDFELALAKGLGATVE